MPLAGIAIEERQLPLGRCDPVPFDEFMDDGTVPTIIENYRIGTAFAGRTGKIKMRIA